MGTDKKCSNFRIFEVAESCVNQGFPNIFLTQLPYPDIIISQKDIKKVSVKH